MNTDVLNQKLSEAVRATSEFVEYMEANNLAGWAGKFRELLNLLEAGDASGALHLRKVLSYSGPGSLSDLMPEDEAGFGRAHGLCDKALGNLRMYIEYEVDRASLYPAPSNHSLQARRP